LEASSDTNFTRSYASAANTKQEKKRSLEGTDSFTGRGFSLLIASRAVARLYLCVQVSFHQVEVARGEADYPASTSVRFNLIYKN
jgi:hypothetical protein